MSRVGALLAGAWLALAPAALAAEAPKPESPAKPAEPPKFGSYLKIPGTRVSLKRPYGMNLSRGAPGIVTADGAISVVVTELERPLSDAREVYRPERVPEAGLQMLGLSEVEIAGYPGFITYMRQREPKAVWLAAFGDESESVVLTGSAPLELAPKVTETIHEILVTARWNRARPLDPYAGLDFQFAGKTPLRYAAHLGPQIFFTRDGRLRGDPEDPELAVSREARQVAKAERDDFCRTTLEQTPGIGLTSTAQQADVRVDGLEGCEMMVAGRELATKQDLLVYQLILFDADGHYLMRGRIGWAQQFRFLNDLLETVRAFKRKA